jgi:hypothetical protein
MAEHGYCRALLATYRREMRGVRLTVTKQPHLHKSYWYTVRHHSTGELLWQGKAHCAYVAKAKALDEFSRRKNGSS